jgi:hypothetical protein
MIKYKKQFFQTSSKESTMKKMILCLIMLLVSCNGWAGIYYVSPSGDDSNPGTSDSPWKTPGHASKQLAAGDTLIIRAGEYTMREFDADMITLNHSGRADAWITIKGEDPSNRPVIKGSNNLLAAIDIGGKSYVRIANLEITSLTDSPYSGGLRSGIEAGGSGGGDVSHVEIKNVEIHHVEETGINVSGNADFLRFEGVHIHHTGMTCLGCPSANGGPGWQNVVIYRCIFEYAGYFYQGREQESPYDRPDGFGIEDSEGPVEIAFTTSRFNLGDGLDSKAKNTYIHHCTVANNFADGVKLWGSGSRLENTVIYGTGYPKPTVQTPWALVVIESDDSGGNFELLNNTLFDDNSRPPHYSMVIQYDNCPATAINLNMQNNIIAGLDRAYIGGCVNLSATNNLFFNRQETEAIQLQHGNTIYDDSNIGELGSGNRYDNPGFVNASWGPEGNFHLMAGSPAIDAGTGVTGTVDIDIEPRIWNNRIDIGADEYKPAGLLDTGIAVNGHQTEGVGPNDCFNITVSLDTKGNSGEGEYYLWVDVPGYGTFWYQSPVVWIESDTPVAVYKGGLVQFQNLTVLEACGGGLPEGNYTLYFSVDNTFDGKVDWTSVSIAELDIYED